MQGLPSMVQVWGAASIRVAPFTAKEIATEPPAGTADVVGSGTNVHVEPCWVAVAPVTEPTRSVERGSVTVSTQPEAAVVPGLATVTVSL